MDSRRVGCVCTDDQNIPLAIGWNGVSRADIGLTTVVGGLTAEIREMI